MARRTTGERAAHKVRRASVRATRKVASSNCGSSGFQAQLSAAQWAAYWAPAAVAARQRQAVAQARQQAAAARSFAAFARKAGFKPTPFKPFTAAQSAAFFASGCKTPKPMKPPRKPVKPKPRKPPSAHGHRHGHRVARPQRAVRPRSAARRPSRPRRPRAVRATRR